MDRPDGFARSLLLGCLILAGLGEPAFAGGRPVVPSPPAGWCATSKANNQRLDVLRAWTASRHRLQPSSLRTGTVTTDGQILLVEATPDMIPFDHPVDLEGLSIEYEPLEGGGFDVQTRSLDYEDDVGSLFHTFVADANDPGWYFRRVDLGGLAVPFGGESRTSFYVTAFNSIHFEPPDLRSTNQYSELEAASFEEPLIAPLLRAPSPKVQFPYPTVYVKISSDAVVVTWRMPSTFFAYDIQARIDTSGTIRLSYRTLQHIEWGTAIVTTGIEPWRDRTRLWSGGQPHLDTGHGSVTGMKTIDFAELDRVGGTDILELTLDLGSRINPGLLTPGDFLDYFIDFGGTTFGERSVELYITRDENWYSVPGWGWAGNSPAMTIDGDRIRMRFFQSALGVQGRSSAAIRSVDCDPVDGICVYGGSFDSTADFGAGWPGLSTDLSAVRATTAIATPFETFTLPVFSPDAVWESVASYLGVSDDEVDGVAMYQTFLTDLILYASAYSTVGNCGVDGISPDISSDEPRHPALLDMNRIDFGLNVDLDDATHVLSHELGHRWLYFIDIDSPGAPANILQPAGGHPAQYVHMPAAFDVYTDHDSSTMGGAFFTDHGDGTFTAPDPVANFGYTWHELYLMGLARPEEVDDWYWIGNSDPSLGDAYYPPAGITVSGVRHDVTIDDVIQAMGPRSPSYTGSQRRFRVPFVLVYRPGDPPSQDQLALLEERRATFTSIFPRITGMRASVDTRLTPPPRRRGVRRNW